MKNIIGLLLIVGALSVWSFYLSDLEDKIEKDEKSIMTNKTEIRKIKQKIAKINGEKTNRREQIAILKKIPKANNQAELLVFLRKIVFKYGYDFEQISFNTSFQPEIEGDQTNMRFSISGPVNNLIPFVAELENSSRFMGLKSVSFSIKNTGNNELSMSVNIFAFSQGNR